MPSPLYGSKFYGLPNRHVDHKPWRLQSRTREGVRGAIRGAVIRERLLHPSSAKALQRRIRLRLLAAYVRRFGHDEFSIQLGVPRIARKRTSNWLSRGYAWWRDRIFGRKPARSL